MSSRKIDMTGIRYGAIVALNDVGLCADGKYKWLCQCDCGNKFESSGSKIRSGETVTCPACSKERVRLSRVKHGMRKTAEYRIWTHIKSRCYNEKVPEFKHYGGRGISMCDRWLSSFNNFIADMMVRPTNKHSIDRIDNNGNYEPSNCRWATSSEQANNTRSNRKITINGTTKNMGQWANENGLRHESVYKRLKRGKSGADIIASRPDLIMLTFNGVSASIKDWSDKTGIKKATLYWRLNTQHWPIEKALTIGAK